MWQEWDAVHIARGRLADRKRDIASYLSKTNVNLCLVYMSSSCDMCGRNWRYGIRGWNETRSTSRAGHVVADDAK